MPMDRLNCVELTLGTLILWMAQAANSPIRRDEAKELLDMLYPKPSCPRCGGTKKIVNAHITEYEDCPNCTGGEKEVTL